MKFIGYGDLHLWHGWPEFNPMDSRGRSTRLNTQFDVLRQIHELADKHQVDGILFGGDLVHKRTFIHNTVVTPLMEFFKKSPIREIMIPGNHDRFDQYHDWAQIIHEVGKVYVLGPGKKWRFKKAGEPDVLIHGAAPGGEIPSFDPDQALHILLAHGQLYGSLAPTGFEFQCGYTLDQFKAYNLVLMADIHKRQQIGNVLIPGTPLQKDWGEAGLEVGCYLIETHPEGTILCTFLSLDSPKFVIVDQSNLEKILEIEKDERNYYDFRLQEAVTPEQAELLKARFPNSYIIASTESKGAEKKAPEIDSRMTLQEILDKYYRMKWPENLDQLDEFVRKGVELFLTAAPGQVAQGHKDIKVTRIQAQNFMSYETLDLDLSKLDQRIYMVTGDSDEETSVTNGIGKSVLAVEILVYTLFDKLARSTTRSKDRLIHDPKKTGKVKDLFTAIWLETGTQKFIVQRYRKHSELGTGSRILTEGVAEIPVEEVASE